MTPFLVVGDFPGQSTGLSRILTDLLTRISGHFADRLEVGVCGYAPWEHLPRTGTQAIGHGLPGRAWAFSNIERWGVEAIHTAYRTWWGNRPGVIFTVWDPGRCFELYQSISRPNPVGTLPVKLWGYFPVDGENVNGILSGPAAEALGGYDRILAYTAYGAELLGRMFHVDDIPHLPHGLDGAIWHPAAPDDPFPDDVARAIGYNPDRATTPLLGCVATNQARKDLGMVFHAVRLLKEQGHPVRLWLHTDQQQARAWNIPQLSADMGLDESLAVTSGLTDETLAHAYRLCAATIAPGRGEGFGYPIAESLACGTPVVHVEYAGGAEFVPAHWRLPIAARHLVGPYAIMRPIVSAESCAATLAKVLQARHTSWSAVSDYCVRWIAGIGLEWTTLWPHWQTWIEEGLCGTSPTSNGAAGSRK